MNSLHYPGRDRPVKSVPAGMKPCERIKDEQFVCYSLGMHIVIGLNFIQVLWLCLSESVIFPMRSSIGLANAGMQICKFNNDNYWFLESAWNYSLSKEALMAWKSKKHECGNWTKQLKTYTKHIKPRNTCVKWCHRRKTKERPRDRVPSCQRWENTCCFNVREGIQFQRGPMNSGTFVRRRRTKAVRPQILSRKKLPLFAAGA